MKRNKDDRFTLREVVMFSSLFVVGWIVTPMMEAGTPAAIRSLVGMLAALVGGFLVGYKWRGK